ncbi:MAG: DUF4291 domain-containing protein [Kofleriaceae bacterium]
MIDVTAPFRQVRAFFDSRTVRVYQAYPPEIATRAIAGQTFRPPFKRDRMTWIKPSFTWMMYRSGWAKKAGQEVVLGIDIVREGFEWALAHSSTSHFVPGISTDEWRTALEASPVRVQWDPERTLKLEPLPWRTIQVGLGGGAVDEYVDNWIVCIEDITQLVAEIESLVAVGNLVGAQRLRPIERPYPLPEEIAHRVGCRAGEVDDDGRR